MRSAAARRAASAFEVPTSAAGVKRLPSFEEKVSIDPNFRKSRPKGAREGGNKKSSMGADYIDYKDEFTPYIETSKDHSFKRRIRTFRTDVKQAKTFYDRRSLTDSRWALKDTDRPEVNVCRELRQCKYTKDVARWHQLVDSLLEDKNEDGLVGLDCHIVSSALAAAGTIFSTVHSEDIFSKGKRLMDKYLAEVKNTTEYPFSAYISLCAKNKKVDDAIECYKLMRAKHPHIKPDPVIFCSLLQACALSGKKDMAKTFFEDAQRRFAHLDQRLFSQAIRFFVGRGQHRYAIGMFNDMVASGLVPTTYDFNVLISACCQSRLTQKTLQVVFDLQKQMVEAGCRPDYYTYEAMLRGCAYNKDLKRAIDLFSEIEGLLNANHFMWFFKTLQSTMNRTQYPLGRNRLLTVQDRCSIALDVLAQMQNFNIKPTATILNSVLSVILKSYQPLKAVIFLRSIHSYGVTICPSTWLTLAKYLTECEPQSKRVVLSALSRSDPTVLTWNDDICKKVDGMCNIYKEEAETVKKAVQELDKVIPQRRAE